MSENDSIITHCDASSFWVDSGSVAAITLSYEADFPSTFRMARYPDGSRIVQGGYEYREGWVQGIRWRDLPMVDVDESGQEIEI